MGTGGLLKVGDGNQLWIGTPNGTAASNGNLALSFGGATTNPYRLSMGNSSYLSAGGYLGGVADKSQAGTAGTLSQATGAISTGSAVVADIAGDWGTVGNYTTVSGAPKSVIGSNNKFNVGGNIGVFANGSVTAGDDFRTSVATVSGSGFFVGSGGFYSAGSNGSYYVHGGMGAAYSAT